MDIAHFFKERLKFANYFYKAGCQPFYQTINLINSEQPPYSPVYDESGEPQFIFEWMQARDGLVSIGHATISMLSVALQMYMNAWLNRANSDRQRCKTGKGWINDLKLEMTSYGVNFSTCPIQLTDLEQMILARNRVQHADDITRNIPNHLPQELEQFTSPIFVETCTISSEMDWFTTPKVYVDERIIRDLTDSLESFCDWLEKESERIEALKRSLP